MRGDKCTNGYQVEPEEFKENSNIKTCIQFTSKNTPKEANNQGAFKQPNAYRIAEQGKEGKKKATATNQRWGFEMDI